MKIFKVMRSRVAMSTSNNHSDNPSCHAIGPVSGPIVHLGHSEGIGGYRPPAGKNKILYLLAAVLLVTVTITYANHFLNGFHFDDSHTMVNNIYIKDIRNIPLFFKDSTTSSSLPSNQAYRPIVTATTAIDYWMGQGLNPFYFHLTMFLFFIAQGFIMYFFYLKIFNISSKYKWNDVVAFVAVAWYMLHPANAETINYFLARSDSISTFFIVLAFVLFIYSSLCRRYHIYLIPLALGGLTKPTAVMFWPLLFVYILLFEEKADLTHLFSKKMQAQLISTVKKSAVTFFFCVGMFVFLRTMDSPTWTPGGLSRFHYLITQPYVLLHYFITFFLPVSLSADTDWKALETILDARFFIGIFFIIALLSAAIKTSATAKLRPISFGILWFLITLIPTSSIIPLAEVMNDHRLFYPYVGLTISICWSARLLLEKASTLFSSKMLFYRATTALIVAALAVYAFGTHVRNNVWHSEESLWKDVTIKSPKNGRGLMNYGVGLMAKGDYAGAEHYFTEALQLVPFYANLYVNLGVVKAATGRDREAEPYFKRAITLSPAWPDGYYFYADFLMKQKRYDEAVLNAQKALSLASATLNARKLLLKVYLERGQSGLLKTLAEQTLLIAPDDKEVADYLALGEKGNSRTK